MRPIKPRSDAATRAVPAALGLALLAGTAAAQAPGQFAIDPEAAERALERALVQTGSVLLPARSAEVVPFFTFQRSEREVAGFPAIINGQLVGTSIDTEQNRINAGLILRAGLPWSGQVDLRLPYVYTDTSQDRRALGATIGHTSSSNSGIGDVGLTYAQTLWQQTGGGPSLIGSVTWDSDTGDEEDGLFLGSGFNEFGVALTATQRQDPLVFSGRVAYEYTLEKDDVQPGDEISFAAGAFLAVNPETSLQFGFSLSYADDVRLNGEDISGSDQLSASLDLGVATILRRNTLLDTALSIGLTDDAPDFAVAVSLPVRFSF